MKQKLSYITSIILLSFIVVWAIWYFGRLLRPVNSDISLATIEAFHELPEDSVDVIIYGSSHPWRGINSLKLQDDYGISNYNYSCMWQKINTTRLFVNDSLRTQNPKLAVIDTYNVSEVLKYTDLVGEVYYTRKIANSPVKKAYLKQCFGNDLDKYAAYYIPFGAFHASWNDIRRANFELDNLKPDNFIKSRGFIAFDEAVHVDLMDPAEYWQEAISDEGLEALDGIVADLNANGTKILFITVPYYSGEYMYQDAMKEYAKSHNCEYLNLLEYVEEIGIDGDTDFSESDHLNKSGADKVADYLGKYIADNYGIGTY